MAFLRKYREYVLLLALLAAYMGALSGVVRYNKSRIDYAIRQVDHENFVIGRIQTFALLIERMLASQRGYVLSGDTTLSDRYRETKATTSDLIAELSALLQGDPAQSSRLNELQHHFLSLSEKLDGLERGNVPPPVPANGIIWKPGETEVTLKSLHDDMIRVTDDALLQEKDILARRTREMDLSRRRGRALFTATGIVFILLSFAGNAFGMHRRGGRAGGVQDPAQDIFRLAAEGLSDGIFEWSLPGGERAFYSKQFWAMLGYQPGRFPDTMQSFKDLLHPEDRDRVLSHIDSYLRGGAAEYLAVFRMRHQNGRWVWINARGRALYDDAGKPNRIVGAHTDISHIKAYEEKLEQAKEYAESANRAKTDFLAHMSHEIRTPLTAISGIAEIFEGAQDNLDSKQRQLVRVLNSSTASLKDLVSDILDFSRIESGELELEEKAFSLRALFDQVVSIVSIKAGEKSIDFTFDYSSLKGQKLLGDPARLRQILLNLIGNAVKFTDKGSVAVTARKVVENGSGILNVEVRDTGIGIDPQNFDLIFERFKQADSSVSRKYGGTGLGLPISLRLARLMGGDITVESVPGKGSVFTLTVPVKLAEAKTEAAAPAPSQPAAVAPGAAKNILLVEDYEGNVVILSYLLDSLKCDYDVAHTGLEALNLWKKNRYDLVLMDVQMPEMDGFTATAQIRRMEQEKDLARTPIIGMTAHALVGDREKCIEAGMDAYLPKPIVETELKAKIAEYLNRDEKTAA